MPLADTPVPCAIDPLSPDEQRILGFSPFNRSAMQGFANIDDLRSPKCWAIVIANHGSDQHSHYARPAGTKLWPDILPTDSAAPAAMVHEPEILTSIATLGQRTEWSLSLPYGRDAMRYVWMRHKVLDYMREKELLSIRSECPLEDANALVCFLSRWDHNLDKQDVLTSLPNIVPPAIQAAIKIDGTHEYRRLTTITPFAMITHFLKLPPNWKTAANPSCRALGFSVVLCYNVLTVMQEISLRSLRRYGFSLDDLAPLYRHDYREFIHVNRDLLHGDRISIKEFPLLQPWQCIAGATKHVHDNDRDWSVGEGYAAHLYLFLALHAATQPFRDHPVIFDQSGRSGQLQLARLWLDGQLEQLRERLNAVLLTVETQADVDEFFKPRRWYSSKLGLQIGPFPSLDDVRSFFRTYDGGDDCLRQFSLGNN
ncbi:MAG: hypothetical protein ABL907_18190 [Hyphomicrobium sp.]